MMVESSDRKKREQEPEQHQIPWGLFTKKDALRDVAEIAKSVTTCLRNPTPKLALFGGILGEVVIACCMLLASQEISGCRLTGALVGMLLVFVLALLGFFLGNRAPPDAENS